MKERPILFNAEMVRAILDGRKTQTRRVVKHPAMIDLSCIVDCGEGWFGDEEGDVQVVCPYGKVSDQLWVRETCKAEELKNGLDGVRYLADNNFIEIENTQEAAIKWLNLKTYGKTNRHDKTLIGQSVPSIHMPRWASRIKLAITNVRVERLQDISEEDAMAEGAPKILGFDNGKEKYGWQTSIEWYQWLWQSINGAESSQANPWVWVIEFKKIN